MTCPTTDSPKLSWLGHDLSAGPELVEVMARLIDDKAIGSQHLAALERRATYEEVAAALDAAIDSLEEDRQAREVLRGEDPETDRLEKIYTSLAAAVSNYEDAERGAERADSDALEAKRLLLEPS